MLKQFLCNNYDVYRALREHCIIVPYSHITHSLHYKLCDKMFEAPKVLNNDFMTYILYSVFCILPVTDKSASTR